MYNQLRKKTFYMLCYLSFAILLIISGCDSNDPNGNQFATLNEEIDYIADQYLQVGLVIGIIDKQQHKHTFSYGTKSLGTNDLPDANTIFEIGSITKSFTATLLADMYLKGNYTDDTVGHYLPAGQVTMPTRNNIEITFLQLATHTSGLPRTPHESGSTFPRPNGYSDLNPYAAYTTEDVYNYLTDYCTLKFEPGTWWEYSNTGYGLLGHIIGLVDGTSYESVLTRDLFQVLGMDNSSLFLTDQQMTNYSLGYNSSLQNVPYYTANDIFQGCGHIKSSLNDMFKYLEANMGLTTTSLSNAMELAHQPQMHQGSMGDQGLAWYILELEDGQDIIYTGGDTNGQSAYLGFNPAASTGIIILSNCAMHGAQLIMGPEILEAIMKY
ncbi:MAG: hypothetical protein A2V66_12290 [Ignavibacteria bacterium RBG_13_36_8]|nr:MAG: hypothetical protein A2V66_12290 [Ignavibacteria bacterium RBG_13_36_8]